MYIRWKLWENAVKDSAKEWEKETKSITKVEAKTDFEIRNLPENIADFFLKIFDETVNIGGRVIPIGKVIFVSAKNLLDKNIPMDIVLKIITTVLKMSPFGKRYKDIIDDLEELYREVLGKKEEAEKPAEQSKDEQSKDEQSSITDFFKSKTVRISLLGGRICFDVAAISGITNALGLKLAGLSTSALLGGVGAAILSVVILFIGWGLLSRDDVLIKDV